MPAWHSMIRRGLECVWMTGQQELYHPLMATACPCFKRPPLHPLPYTPSSTPPSSTPPPALSQPLPSVDVDLYWW